MWAAFGPRGDLTGGRRVACCYAAGAFSAAYVGDAFAKYFRTASTFQNCYVLSSMGASSTMPQVKPRLN